MKIFHRYTNACIFETDKETLRGADLEGANLEGADLRGADLEGADLRGADLEGANLEGADLEGANLEGADLRGADLRGANLRGANLIGANLRDADLRGANLRDADLRGAKHKDIKIMRMASMSGIYNYNVIVCIDDKDVMYIGLGCKWGSEEYWKTNFWNNVSEFPDDGSEKTERRKIALETAIKIGNTMRMK